MNRLPQEFYVRDPLVVARELLGKVLLAGSCAGRIVETEAYRSDDPASHSFRGETARNAVMFGDAGRLYVYFTYGMHYCANVVTGSRGEGSAVLIRAVEPLRGVELMQSRRPAARRMVDLTNGPAKVCQAFGIDLAVNGVDLVASEQITVSDEVQSPVISLQSSARVGISRGRELPWRFFDADSPYVGRTPRYD